MKNALLVGAMIVAAGISQAYAKSKAVTYGFSGYCDGVTYTPGVAPAPTLGQHIYDQTSCVYPNGDMGGFASSIKSLGAGTWYTFATATASGGSNPQDFTVVLYINAKALTWQVAGVSTDSGYQYAIYNSGTLTKGAPPAMHAPGKMHSVVQDMIARLKAQQHKN